MNRTYKLLSKTFFAAAFVLSVFVFSSAVYAQPKDAGKTPEMKEKNQKSLYQRLGGYDAIAAVSDEFLVRLGANKRLQRFVVGLSDDSKKKLRQHLVDFLCSATGGPCFYLGRDMKTAHTGLGIDEEDWKAGVDALVATLDKFKVPEKEKSEVLAAVGSLKKDIVEKK